MKAIVVVWMLLLISAHAQELNEVRGSSETSFRKHTLQLPQLTEESYPMCGKMLRDVIPARIFGGWAEASFQAADGLDGTKILPYLAKIASRVLDEKNDLVFMTYEKMKSTAVAQPIRIDSRIIIRFDRDGDHPLLGSKYLVLNVDSEKKIAYLKYGENVALLSVEP